MSAWDLSCSDWEVRLKSCRPPIREDLPLWPEGDRAVAIFKKLRLADVPGNPTMAEAGDEWIFAIVRALFGSLDPVTRSRMIRELFLLVPKKNSKTTYGALIMVTALLVNERPSAPFIMTAPVQDVAELAFEAARGAIGLDSVLEKKFHVRDHLKTIIHRETKAALQIMTFDPAVLTGQKAAGVLIDELHVVAKMAKAASAIRQLRGGMLPYPEAFMAFITTQSEEAPSGVFRAELTKARMIRDGAQRGAMLPVLYEFPEAMQKDREAWRSPANWRMVTPNAGRSITIERLVEEYETAVATGEEELRGWASQHLNIEIGLALRSDRWAGADFWEGQARDDLTFEEVIRRSEVVAAGIDGGGLDDLLGFAIVGRDRETREWLSWSRAWAHPILLERRKSEAQRFLDFERDGDLVITEEMGDAEHEIARLVRVAWDAGVLYQVGVDPYGIGSILDAIVAAGVPQKATNPDRDVVLGISQGWKMNAAIMTAERALAAGTLVHGGRPLMAWCVGNARVEPKGNAKSITKQASGTAKIDPLMALLDAVAIMSLNPGAPKAPDYRLTFV